MNNKLRNYFDSKADNPRSIGIYPIGTGLDIEIPYRQFWEIYNFKKFLPRKRDLRILELGCGAGRWGIALSHIVTEYIGVDFSSSQIKIAQNDAERLSLKNLSFIETDILNYSPTGKSKFDIIYSSGVLQYINDNEVNGLIKRMKCFLKEGGFFIDRSTVVIKNDRIIKDDPNYFSIYRTPEENISLFNENGFHFVSRKQSYPFLRSKTFWENKPVKKISFFCLNTYPIPTFFFMRGISQIIDFLNNQKKIISKGVMYSHDFFVFKINLNRNSNK